MQSGKFKMLDMTKEEFEKFERENEEFVFAIQNFFYLANDDKKVEGKVNFVNSFEEFKDCKGDDGSGAVVLYFEPKDLKYFKKKCDSCCGFADFYLIDGKTEAFFSIININDKEYVGLVIPNIRASFDLPFSKEGRLCYEEACIENYTLPYAVESDLIYDLVPDKYKKYIEGDKFDGKELN